MIKIHNLALKTSALAKKKKINKNRTNPNNGVIYHSYLESAKI